MKFSQLYCPTMRNVPNDAEIISHQLMLRAGLIRKLSSGLYSYLPIGRRIIQKFEAIVREEMDKVGGQEVLLPSVIPSELWKETGRWDKYGKELLRIKDRNDKEFCYGPTHEEVITDLVRQDIKSYKQLPQVLYQIQTKFRDEIRPRFGVMRSREFVMKDAYSFHANEQDLDNTYQDMRNAYSRIFERCGLKFKVVEADSGAMGGSSSAEFMVLSATGEDLIIECNNCDYAANVEAAQIRSTLQNNSENSHPGVEKISTPNVKTIQQLSGFLKADPKTFIKTLIYKANKNPILVLIRGDHEANEAKIKNAINCDDLEMADEKTVNQITGASTGYAGPVGLSKLSIIADNSVQQMGPSVSGANETDMHLKNVVPERDFKAKYFDLRNAEENDNCPRCQKGSFRFTRGIEVGHVFKLGKKYSEDLSATYLDQNGKSQTMTMGCYGIGIGRTVAAAIEQYHDEKGIKWPSALAPFKINVILTSSKDADLKKEAVSLYDALVSQGEDVILDDRDVSAGVKFKDSELIGFPVQVVVGKSFQANGQYEVVLRQSGQKERVEKALFLQKVGNYITNGY